jgi:hypothetical protein
MFTLAQGRSLLMPLLGNRYDDYTVMLEDDTGNVYHERVCAPDVETAAYNALELSKVRNLRLKNVIKEDQW